MTAATKIDVSISDSLLERFPGAAVDLLVCKVPISNPKKGAIKNFLSNLKKETVVQLVEEGISSNNLEDVEEVKVWRKTFSAMGLDSQDSASPMQGLPKIQSSLINLLQRAASQADIVREDPKTKPDLDLYNCVSLQKKCPMGAYDATKIVGNKIELTLGATKNDEMFLPLLSAKERENIETEDYKGFPVDKDHVVYADAEGVLTWLWNYRDGDRCCVPSESKDPATIMLFADTSFGADEGNVNAKEAIALAAKLLPEIGGEVTGVYHLDAKQKLVDVAV